jgi:hypothetical protein
MKSENTTMQQAVSNDEILNIPREKLVLLFGHLFGGGNGNPNPDEPIKPGPWDPVIRKVSRYFFGPSPEPWQSFGHPVPSRSEFNMERLISAFIAARHPEIYEIIGGGRFNRAELNPQPLPPKAAFIVAFTEEAMDRILLMQEVADALNQTGERQGIIIVGGKLASLVDELCGNNFKIKIPVPHPKHESDNRLSGLELITAGAVFEQISTTVANKELQEEMRNAAGKLIVTGISRI